MYMNKEVVRLCRVSLPVFQYQTRGQTRTEMLLARSICSDFSMSGAELRCVFSSVLRAAGEPQQRRLFCGRSVCVCVCWGLTLGNNQLVSQSDNRGGVQQPALL